MLDNGTRILHGLPIADLFGQPVVISIDGEASAAHQYVIVEAQLVSTAVGTYQLDVGSIGGAHVIDSIPTRPLVEVYSGMLTR